MTEVVSSVQSVSQPAVAVDDLERDVVGRVAAIAKGYRSKAVNEPRSVSRIKREIAEKARKKLQRQKKRQQKAEERRLTCKKYLNEC